MTCHDKSGKPDLLAVRYTGTSARVTTGEPRTDGELAEIRLTLKVGRSPVRPPNGESTSPDTSSRFRKRFSPSPLRLPSRQRPFFAALSVGLYVTHSAARSVGEAHNKTTTTRRTFDGHIEDVVALLDGVRCL